MSSPLPGTTPQGPLLPAGNPRIVGIVNITEDSFSDGGRYLGPAAAVAHARNLRAEGADIVELGPAASHPDSAPVSVAEERRRLAPVLEQLAADGVPVSVDSFRTETLRYAISAGAACLNDIHGFGDPDLSARRPHPGRRKWRRPPLGSSAARLWTAARPSRAPCAAAALSNSADCHRAPCQGRRWLGLRRRFVSVEGQQSFSPR